MPPETQAETQPPKETASPVTFPININLADREQLMALPGIGETLADRILAYRETHGAFPNVTDLMNVEGIGEKRMEEMLELVTTGGIS